MGTSQKDTNGSMTISSTVSLGEGDGERGFTLVELMITVAIVAVLALLATVGYGRWVRSSKTAEATSMIGTIKGAQESYRSDTLKYLAVSASLTDWYPSGSPNDQKATWDTTLATCTGACAGFRTLNVTAGGPVYYRYASIAGTAGAGPGTIDGHVYPAMNDSWYVVNATGDLNANTVQSRFYSSSTESTIWSVNPDE